MQTKSSYAERAGSYINSDKGPGINQCCLWGKKNVKEKFYYFIHPPQGPTNSHPHINQKKEWGHEKKESHAGSKK